MGRSLQSKEEPAPIKSEPDSASGSVGTEPEEDDLYEDAGDLEFFDPAGSQGSFDQAYLAKVPKVIWDAWSELPGDAEVEIGTMRQWDLMRPDGTLDVSEGHRLLTYAMLRLTAPISHAFKYRARWTSTRPPRIRPRNESRCKPKHVRFYRRGSSSLQS